MIVAAGTPFAASHYAQPGYGRIVATSEGRRYEVLPVEQLDSPAR